MRKSIASSFKGIQQRNYLSAVSLLLICCLLFSMKGLAQRADFRLTATQMM